eukprot:TRINITY_DN33203_c0_g1_i1.p1 TRINITY_DN33203_c0_g1~~TRINITY_DN33203_c0_g1_i1.p1  ORF type:complete len:145 (+),score=34.32 TRINITY_DN33203_c0_g1_i1:63-497(+)
MCIRDSITSVLYSVELNHQLGIPRMLTKDFKVFSYSFGIIGYSAIYLSIDNFLKIFSKDEITKSIDNLGAKLQLNAHLLLFISRELRPDGFLQIRKEGIIHSKDPELLQILEKTLTLSLIHISEPTRLGMISYAVFCLKKKKDL